MPVTGVLFYLLLIEERPLNSNELNERLLLAKLDPACFQIVYAYLRRGGWKPGQEVYLSRADYESYGIIKRTLSDHRKHLIACGILVPTGNRSEKLYDKFLVVIPEGQILHDPQAESASPPSNIRTAPVQELPTEAIKSNELSNQGSNQEEEPESISARESTQKIPCESSSGLIEIETAPSASGEFPAPAGTPPGQGFSELDIQARVRSIRAREAEHGIHNTDEHLRKVAMNQLTRKVRQ